MFGKPVASKAFTLLPTTCSKLLPGGAQGAYVRDAQRQRLASSNLHPACLSIRACTRLYIMLHH